MLVRPLGYPDVQVRFASSQELSTDLSTQLLEPASGLMPTPGAPIPNEPASLAAESAAQPEPIRHWTQPPH
jgi:hypothetical protein